MLISGEKAIAVYKKIAQVRDHYRATVLRGDSNRLFIEDFQKVVADMYQITITKAQVGFSGTYVRGMMERYENLVKIRVRLDLAQEWKRFTAVKELCHVIIDEPEDWSVDGIATLRDLVVEYALESGPVARRVLQSEALAEIAAVEMMYPFECRAHDLKAVLENMTTEVKIAHYYGLPPSIVERALNQKFHDGVAAPLWREVAAMA